MYYRSVVFALKTTLYTSFPRSRLLNLLLHQSFALDLFLCVHDDCLLVLLAQEHISHFRKIHQLLGAIIKHYPSDFENGLAPTSRRIIRLVRVIFQADKDHFHDYFFRFQFGLHLT